MRASFLILLLANILFLAWSFWVASPASSALATAAPADPRSMQLAKEAALPADAAAPQADARAGGAIATCVSFGPFLDDASLGAASQQLGNLGYEARRRAAVEDVQAGQWVSVADLATPQDAANALNALRRAGLTDSYMVTEANTAPGTTISVGVFNAPAGAAEAADAVRRAGLAPRVTARVRTAEVTWLDVDRRTNEGLPDIAAVRVDQDSAPLEMRACPATG